MFSWENEHEMRTLLAMESFGLAKLDADGRKLAKFLETGIWGIIPLKQVAVVIPPPAYKEDDYAWVATWEGMSLYGNM